MYYLVSTNLTSVSTLLALIGLAVVVRVARG